MLRPYAGTCQKDGSAKRRLLGVSEAVGTVLLLGISVTLAGGIALWTANIDEGEEGIYVDLWATVQGSDLVITHRGGDHLEGSGTRVIIMDSDGNQVITGTYSDLTGTVGETWGPGEELVIDISSDTSVTNTFKVVVTAQRESGESVVLLNNELVRSGSVGGLPDLAVTRVHMEDGDGTVVNTILDNGAYDIVVRVTNFGADMTEAHMTDAGDGRVENLRIFDSNEPMETSSVTLEHFTSGDDPIQETADNFGILANGEYMVSTFTWDATSSDPRSLGIHTMNVKVIPVFSGEQNYRNNYVEKRFKVDKELTPLDIHGPDPGIYDIYFSNEAPNSGEEVTVTVIVQNSGDQPILAETGVNMVVTTWEPKKEHDSYSEPEIHDWRMDYEDHYGEWRSNNSEDVEITEDDTFPTCVRTNLELLSGAYLFFYFTLEARVDVPGGEQWVYAAIDPYNDNSKPQAIGYNPGGDDPGDNMRFGKIQVLPRILLVDDDEATTGSDGDMVSTVRESLVGAGVTLDKIFVAQQVSDNANTRDAPAFTYNQEEIAAPAMEDYDIVIWVTGSVKDPFTNIPNDHETNIGGNIQEIMKYLDSNRYLMVVGTDPFDGLMSYFGSGMTTDKLVIDDETDDASDFLYKYLGIEEVISDVDIPVEDPIRLYSMDILIDLQASIEEGNLIISHEKGDPLTGSETYINIYDDTGVPVETGTYSSYSGTSGEDWMSGSSVEVELSALSSLSTYDLEVTTSREYGTPIIVHRNQILTQDTGEEPELLYTDVYQGGIFSREDTIELLDQEAGNGGMNLFVPRGIYEADKFEEPVGVLTNAEESVQDTPSYNTIRSFSTPDPDLFDASYRAVVMAWNVTQIKHLNEKVDIFSNVLNWFDWEVEVGRDLAVTRMNLYILKEEESGWVNDPVSEDNSPKYLDTILIEAYVRNNGPNLESSSVMFYVTGPDGVELPITPNIPDPTNDLEPEEYDNPHDMNGLAGGGTEVSIYKLWLAVGVGTYTFRVVVDPFHLITEISEENNDISYSTSTVTSFITKNNILVVDDDMSDDNFPDDMDPVVMGERMIDYTGLGGEPSLVVEDTLTSLSYDFDQHLVKNDKIEGQWDYDSGLSILDLKRYNSILWVTGDSGEKDENARETFTDDDLEAIKRYLDGDYPEAKYLPEGHHENLMIIGSGFMDDLMVSNDPIQMTSGTYDLFDIVEGYFGVKAEAPGSLTGVSLRGPTDGRTTDKVYLGVDYGQAELDSSFAASSLSMLPDPTDEYADPVEGLWAEDAVGNSILVSAQYNYDNTGSTLADEKNFRVVLHSWQLTRSSSLSQESPLREMLYLPLHWFDTPEDEPELVGRSCKISVDTDNPVIGNSYVVQAEVANIGGVPGGGTVRFMDGSILVQSENIYMDPDTSTTIEAIWKPLYAGERTITVWIDRYNDYDEVFDTINNAPSITLDVYFFWDDMESGDGNWEHDSTVLRINGEGTLDYMAEPTYTNIEKEWGAMDGFHKNTDVANTVVQREFYSSPSSYYMYEPNLGGTSRKDIDLVMMLDTSGSMDDDGWDSSIGDDQPIGDMKIAAKNVVDQLTPDDRLALYTFSYSSPLQRLPFTYMTQEERESAKELIDDLSANGWTPLWDSVGETINYAVNHQRTTDVYTAAITLTDGDDYGSWGREDGSTVYCPGSEVGTSYDTCTWGAPTGLKWDDVDLDFRNQGTYNGDDVIRVGGGGASIDGSWLNLWDETRTGLIHAPIPVYTVGLGISPHEEDPLNPTIGS
ncbi:MAG: VWA domain-containing protein, partial [Thermoplasmatota archaeon]